MMKTTRNYRVAISGYCATCRDFTDHDTEASLESGEIYICLDCGRRSYSLEKEIS